MESLKKVSERPVVRRRRHKNSKLGCPNCKKRRVKCSEDLPSCMNCIKHKVRCGYLDYTEEQLRELRNHLLQNEVDEYSERSLLIHGSISGKFSDDSGSSSHLEGIAEIGPGGVQDYDENEYTDTTERKLSAPSDVLNFQQTSITQIFDTLLSTSMDNTLPIIYPIYTISKNTSVTSEIDLINNEAFNDSGSNSSRTIHPLKLQQDNSIQRQLPGSIISTSKFDILPQANIDHTAVLVDMVKKAQASILRGTSTLGTIRYLFDAWLNSFFDLSNHSEAVFSCMLNLTTNYVITVSYKPSNLNHGNLERKKKLKNYLLVSSIKQYAKVIKGLRHFLNNNSNSHLCSLVSYILLLMSIYDPEATLNSLNCFRDGLFGVLTYNINIANNNFTRELLLNTAHLKLMTNVVRSVYSPGYDPTFLHELKETLETFGKILDNALEVSNNDTLSFVFDKYKELLSYTEDTVNEYEPTINGNLSDIEIQQQTLFDMLYRWVRLYPPKLCVVRSTSDPFELLLYLFFKAMTKSLYAVFPQIKYFFLRDFDSPLMLDLYMSTDNFSIYDKSIESPASCCVPMYHYEEIKPEFKKIASYLIRLNTFFLKRVEIIYKLTVFGEKSQKHFPIVDERKWRKEITDIYKAREDFSSITGLTEIPIKLFKKTLIKPFHFPCVSENSQIQIDQDNDDAEIDFLTLKLSGLLEHDFSI